MRGSGYNPLVHKVLPLHPDNFTPPSRTPWGGTRLLARWKHDAVADPGPWQGRPLGESWELSVEPDFPSRVLGRAATLAEVVADDPVWWLGREARAGHRGTGLLVKLLDSAQALSVQIHPADDYAGLSPEESGKPECWYVVEAEAGAGVYLGLRPEVTDGDLRAALEGGGDVSAMLNFVPCAVGDFFRIDPGTAHAIGPGLVLVEPQRVIPGRRGLTYRYWDWGRRYAADGRLDPKGAPRALHVHDALAVTDWGAPRGEAFVREVLLRAGTAVREGAPRLTPLCGATGGGLPSPALQVARLTGDGAVSLPDWDALLGITVLEGAVTVDGVTVAAGCTAAVAAGRGETVAQLGQCHAVLSAVY